MDATTTQHAQEGGIKIPTFENCWVLLQTMGGGTRLIVGPTR